REQEIRHHLSRQRLSVCRTSEGSYPSNRRAPGLPLPDTSPWRTLYGGCCSVYFRRHVIVRISSPNEGGSIVVQAALIQNRADYLRKNWDNVRPWAWRWCLLVALFLAGVRVLLTAIRALVKTGRRVANRSAEHR